MGSEPSRVVVSWEGSDQPIIMTIHGPDGEVVSTKLSPTRALDMAKDLIEPAVAAIKHSMWGPGWPG